MAGENIYALTGFTHGSAIAGATYARIVPQTTHRRDAVKQRSVVTDRELAVEVYGNNARALYARIGVAKANAVLAVKGRAGAVETHTVKDVEFVEAIGAAEIPEADGGGKLASAGIRGFAVWGDDDTFETMWTVT